MAKRIVVVAVLLAGLLLPALAQAENNREKIILKVKPAVVLVYSEIKVAVSLQTQEGIKQFDPIDMSGAGTGFIVNPDGYIITNGHVVKDYHSKDNSSVKQQAILYVLKQYIFPALAQRKGSPLTQAEMVNIYKQLLPYFSFQITKRLFVFLSNWQQYVAEIKQYSPPITPLAGKSEGIISYEEEESGKDIAILKIEQGNLPTVKLGDSDDVRLQEAVFPAGFPGVVTQHQYLSQMTMMEATITSGHVSSLKTDVKGTPVIQFDASVTWGNSGGPVFNDRGEVIGIATFISLKQTGQGSAMPIQGFNFAVPINTAKEFLRSAGTDPRSGLFDTLWGEALDMYFDNDYQDLIPKCDEILRLLPNQPDARRLQVKAQTWLTAHPPSFMSRYWWIFALAGGFVVVIGVITMVTVSNRNRVSQAAAAPRSSALKATVVDVHAERKQLGSFGRIVCEKGPSTGKHWDVPSSGLSIGRDPTQCQVVIPDDHVSKVHAVLKPTPTGLLLEDNGSTNGTFVNQVGDHGIQSTTLKKGDRIILGSRQAAIFRVE